MEIAGRGIGEPRSHGEGVVDEERVGGTVSVKNEFIGEVVANLAVSEFGRAVFDGVGVGAGLIHGIVVHEGPGG